MDELFNLYLLKNFGPDLNAISFYERSLSRDFWLKTYKDTHIEAFRSILSGAIKHKLNVKPTYTTNEFNLNKCIQA